MNSHPVISEDETLVSAGQLRAMLGGRSDMWLWRRQKDPNAEFPEPTVIANRRYWKLGEIRAWIAAQAAKGKTRGPAAAGTAALLLILALPLAPSGSPIGAPRPPVVTLPCAPGASAITEIVATQAFYSRGATAGGAGVRKLVPSAVLKVSERLTANRLAVETS
jgi:hypothetical protein